jgi:hypothetical protein
MTSFFDNVKVGRAAYNRNLTPPTGYAEDESYGIPLTQTYVYQAGTASTSLASGVFYASSALAGTLTGTGVLVSGGVATFDVPRCVTITASSNMSTTTFTIQGTDAYGAPITASLTGPTGNTLGTSGSFVNTLSAFKTVTTASSNGAATGALTIGNTDTFGMPFRIPNVGYGMGVHINGESATVPATWTAGLAATGVATATTADVRGTVALATTVLSNGSRYFSFEFITPNTGIAAGADTKENSYGVTPFTS